MHRWCRHLQLAGSIIQSASSDFDRGDARPLRQDLIGLCFECGDSTK